MKILNAEQIRAADAHTIAHEPISAIDLMERAGVACFKKIRALYPNQQHYTVYCGTGNNGGDGLVIARLLANQGCHVDVVIVCFSDRFSDEHTHNSHRLQHCNGVNVTRVRDSSDLPTIYKESVIIDALVGNGITRPLEGLLKETVAFINRQPNVCISIDLPSGLSGEANHSKADTILEAAVTLTFQTVKLNFLLPDFERFVGRWIVLDIGLSADFIHKLESNYILVDEESVRSLYKKRSAFAHKGTFGHSLIIAGSHGKMGAAILSAKAALRSGSGLVSAYIPSCGYTVLQTSNPEVMVETSASENVLSEPITLEKYTAIGIGPGIGTATPTATMVQALMQNEKPMVIDADALNILSQTQSIKQLPKKCLLTPHLKEFDRLFGPSSSSHERLQKQLEASKSLGVYIVLKGRYTCLSTPEGKAYFNPTGNPGMATAGSGDVLTGIVTGLLSQSYSPFEAGVLGIYLHGVAGDLAKEKYSEEALIASDIIEHLGAAYKLIQSAN